MKVKDLGFAMANYAIEVQSAHIHRLQSELAALKQENEALIERCARICERRAEERFSEHGTTEYDTNASYYGGSDGGELEIRDEEDSDCAAAIRELLKAKP